MKHLLVTLFLLISFLGFGQSVSAPDSKSFIPSTTGQDASGFVLSGFSATSTLLTSISLVNPPSGTTFYLNDTRGLVAASGFTLSGNKTRLVFTGTMASINTALQSLKVNTGATKGEVKLSVAATVNPVGYYYNGVNGHFYRPISTGATYINAKTLASQQTFKGQQGYLVTITSADEDAFIFNNVPQTNIWFALSDAASEARWTIDAGPEAGTLIKINNGQLNGNIPGQYNNWAPGEPNDSGNEDYAVTKWNGSQWNDLPNNFSCAYVIEYGTWTDPANQTFTDFFTGFVTHQISCSPATSPSAPTGTNGSRMNAGTVVISATPPAGSTVDWYTNSVGGNVISGGLGVTTYTTPSISNTTTYFAQSRNTTNGCVSSTRTAVVATVNYPIPFVHSGFVYGSEGIGIPNVPVKLLKKLTSETNYTLHGTYNTNTNGQYNITTNLNATSYNFQIVIDNLRGVNK